MAEEAPDSQKGRKPVDVLNGKNIIMRNLKIKLKIRRGQII